MASLIERLRSGSPLDNRSGVEMTMREAADEIERLRALFHGAQPLVHRRKTICPEAEFSDRLAALAKSANVYWDEFRRAAWTIRALIYQRDRAGELLEQARHQADRFLGEAEALRREIRERERLNWLRRARDELCDRTRQDPPAPTTIADPSFEELIANHFEVMATTPEAERAKKVGPPLAGTNADHLLLAARTIRSLVNARHHACRDAETLRRECREMNETMASIGAMAWGDGPPSG
jgi:hypothetical protein